MKIKIEKDRAVIDNTFGFVLTLLILAVMTYLFVSIVLDFIGSPKEYAAVFIGAVFIALIGGFSLIADARLVRRVTVGEEGVHVFWLFRSKLVKWDDVIGYEYINVNYGKGTMPSHVQIIWLYGAKRRKLKSPSIKRKLKAQYMEQIFQVCDMYFDVPKTAESTETND